MFEVREGEESMKGSERSFSSRDYYNAHTYQTIKAKLMAMQDSGQVDGDELRKAQHRMLMEHNP